MIAFFARLYRSLINFGIYLAPVALLILRIGWGYELYQSGHGHLTHLQDTIDNFKGWDIPLPKASAIMAGTTEMVGGILVMAGLATRLISIPLFFNFCVAFATASKDNVKHIFSQDLSKIVDDAAYPFWVMSLLLIAFGPGIISIDAILKKTLFKKYAAGL